MDSILVDNNQYLQYNIEMINFFYTYGQLLLY